MADLIHDTREMRIESLFQGGVHDLFYHTVFPAMKRSQAFLKR